MKLTSHLFIALAAALALQEISWAVPAESSGHGAQLVVDRPTAPGPEHGGAQGTWIAPGLQEGRVVAKLYDTQGIERFLLDGTLIQYQFLVAAPAQGELLGQLLVPHETAGGNYIFDMKQIFALVEGQWIETGNGRGAFSASIFALNPDPEQPLVPIGDMQGTFQLVAEARAARPAPSQIAPASSGGAASTGSTAGAIGHESPVPPTEILLATPRPKNAHGLKLLGGSATDSAQDTASTNHGGLGQVALGTGAVASGISTAAIPSRGRVTLRWQLYE
jgi:hypothetical protein